MSAMEGPHSPPDPPLVVRELAGPTERAAMFDLRRRVLRPHTPPDQYHWPAEPEPGVVHLGAFRGARLVGTASLYPEAGWRLRAVAVEPDCRGQGIGTALVAAIQARADAAGYALWCNARDSALGFYARLGWTVDGPGFTSPDIGPHHVMRRPAP